MKIDEIKEKTLEIYDLYIKDIEVGIHVDIGRDGRIYILDKEYFSLYYKSFELNFNGKGLKFTTRNLDVINQAMLTLEYFINYKKENG